MCITYPIGLIPFPVAVSFASPALSSDCLCHDNVRYVKKKKKKKKKKTDFRKLADFEK